MMVYIILRTFFRMKWFVNISDGTDLKHTEHLEDEPEHRLHPFLDELL